MKVPKRHLDKLPLPGFFALLVFGAYILSRSSISFFSNLGSSLVAEFIGAAVTVFGIDYLIKRREENSLLPVKAATYEDVRLLVAWALGLWRNAYSDSVNDKRPSTWEELLSEEALGRIRQSLDITKLANVLPQQDWGCYLDNELDRIYNHAEKILERHGGILEPEVHNAIYKIIYFGGQTYRTRNIRRIDHDQGIPRPSNLGSHFPAAREWFDAALYLHNWTIATNQRLTRGGVRNIFPPAEFQPFEFPRPLTASLENGNLQKQLELYKEWQGRQQRMSG